MHSDFKMFLIFKEHRTQGDSREAEERACWKTGIAGQSLVSKKTKNKTKQRNCSRF